MKYKNFKSSTFFLTIFIILIPLTAICEDSHRYKNPEDVVAKIYRDFAFEAIMSSLPENESLIEQPKEKLSLYFTDELASLIVKDEQCVKNSHEICNLDFNIIFASQDPGAMDLQISPADKTNTVLVEFRYPGNKEKISLIYETEKTNKGWRIRDIIYSSGQLSKILIK